MALADRPGEILTAAELAELCEIPAGNVPAIVSTLSRVDILTSSRGRSGGCTLARPASEISIMEVVHALEGPPVGRTRCLLDSSRCVEPEMYCAVHAAYTAGRDAALEALAQTSLEEAAKRQRKVKLAQPRKSR